MSRRSILISPEYIITDDDVADVGSGFVRQTPADTWAGGLGALLDRVAKTFTGPEGTILVTGTGARALRLPATRDEHTDDALFSARNHGWRSGTKVRDWNVFHHDTLPTVYLGILPLIDTALCPLIKGGILEIPGAVSLWHELAGAPWEGHPGMAGMKILERSIKPIKVRDKAIMPTWKPKDHGPAGPDVAESKFHPRRWSREDSGRYEHSYDCSRAYLAGAGACDALAPFSLKATGKIPFTPRRAGWWQVELAPWQHATVPAPWGGDGAAGTRWLTTPTVALLEELAAEGVYGGVEVLASWTAEGKRLLRPWAERVEKVYQTAVALETQRDVDGNPTHRAGSAPYVRAAAKLVYSRTWGLLNSPTNWCYRPDWHHAILAQSRVNLWRKMWRIGTTEARWPLRIDTDNVWYASDDPDPYTAAPDGITVVRPEDVAQGKDKLGTFKTKGTNTREEAVAA